MGKVDKQKDILTNLRLYMTITIIIVMSISTGLINLYNSNTINYSFYIGTITALCLLVIFVLLAKKLHQETDKLEEMD